MPLSVDVSSKRFSTDETNTLTKPLISKPEQENENAITFPFDFHSRSRAPKAEYEVTAGKGGNLIIMR